MNTDQKISEQEQPEYERKMDFMIDIMQKKFGRQQESFNALSNKMNYLFGLTTVILGGYLTFLHDGKIMFSCNVWLTTLNLVAIFGFISAIICLVLATKTRAFPDAPNTKLLHSKKSFKMPLPDLKNQIISDMKKSYDDGLQPLDTIAKWLNRSLYFLCGSIIIAIIGSVLQTIL